MLAGLIVGAVVVGVVAATRPTPGGGGRVGQGQRRIGPGVALAGVVAAIYLNQVLFTVYVLRERGGDPGFVERYVPEGWFDLAEGPAIETLARNFPAPWLLAPSVLRVNALLELPFVVLAYLTVCRWSWPWTYERALRLVPLMSVVCTATFVLVEWRLRNPYTVDDTFLRVVAAVAVPLGARYLSPAAGPPESGSDRRPSLAGLLVFLASAAGLGLAGLVVYDTALLYNLGHLDAQLPLAGAAVAVIGVTRWAAPRVADRPAGPTGMALALSTGWLLVVAMVPAMPVRYGLTFGAPYVAAAGGLVIAVVAAGLGVRDADAPVAHLVVAGAAGSGGAALGLLVEVGHTETRLLAAGVAGFLAAVAVAAVSGGTVTEPAPPAPPRPGSGATG